MEAMATTPTKLSKKIQWLIDQNDLKQSELAEIAGVTQATVSQYLAGSVPGATVLLKIAREFGLPMEWLVDDEMDIHHVDKAVRESISRYPLETVISFVAGRFTGECDTLEKYLRRSADLPFDKVAQELQAAEDADEPIAIDDEGAPEHIRAALRAALAIYFLPRHTVHDFRVFDMRCERAASLLKEYESIFDRLSSTEAGKRAFMQWSQGQAVSMEREAAITELDESIAQAKKALAKK